MEIYLDADDQIVGRMCSVIAKRLLKGDTVFIVNAEKAVVSGRQQAIFEAFRQKISRGDPYNGPFYPNVPDRVLKRSVRGMLPKNPRGREALKRLKVFLSVPGEFKGKKFEKIKEAENNLDFKFTTLGRISQVVSGRQLFLASTQKAAAKAEA